jgi:hypothetical protein
VGVKSPTRRGHEPHCLRAIEGTPAGRSWNDRMERPQATTTL